MGTEYLHVRQRQSSKLRVTPGGLHADCCLNTIESALDYDAPHMDVSDCLNTCRVIKHRRVQLHMYINVVVLQLRKAPSIQQPISHHHTQRSLVSLLLQIRS